MNCVNTSTSTFKELAKRNNVSESKLELIVHQYWLEDEGNTEFPSDVYIQAQLGNTKYREPSKAVREVWKTKYFKPQEFSSLKEVQQAVTEAQKFFPPSVIVYYKNNNGTFTLSVRQPVASLKHSINDFFKEGTSLDAGHFRTPLKGNQREQLFNIHDGIKRQLMFMEEDQVKETLKTQIQNSDIPKETVEKISSAIDKMTKKQILSEIELMDREQEDFNIVLQDLREAVESIRFQQEKQESPAAAEDEIQFSMDSPKHTFTFADGTKVETPFKLNDQQTDALNAMNAFLHSNEAVMTLSGYAGTGKTSLMEILADKAKKDGISIKFTASTNKAAKVLKNRVFEKGFFAQTLHKLFAYELAQDETTEYDAKKHITTRLEENAKYRPGDVIVIDEASMINDDLYRDIVQDAKNNHLKIIFVGDKKQLAPVGQKTISSVFKNNQSKVVELTKVERTGDNAILAEATRLRNDIPLTGISSFNSKGQGVAYMSKQKREELEKIIRYFTPNIKANPDYFRILAWSNNVVSEYNNMVRSILGYSSYVPQVGEPMMGYTNWGYKRNASPMEDPYDLVNSESYKVVAVGNPQTLKKSFVRVADGKDVAVEIESIPITLENSVGEVKNFDYIDVKQNAKNRNSAIILAQQKADLWNKYRTAPRGRADTYGTKGWYAARAGEIERFLFVNDDITKSNPRDPNKPITLQAKVIDFGYAMTVHKSQGSTFTHVLVDDVNISKASGFEDTAPSTSSAEVSSEDLKTANETIEPVGPKKKLNIPGLANLLSKKSSQPETLISQAPAPKPANTNTDAADIVQQLKYVAVSRATDTVTIISDIVKKEDSPLNHINDQNKKELHVETPTSWTSKTGKVASGKYISTRDADGFIHIKYEGQAQARLKVNTDIIKKLNLFEEDIIGEEKDYNDPSMHKEVRMLLYEEGIYIDSVTIRPNGEVSIALADGNGVIEGRTAVILTKFLFPDTVKALMESRGQQPTKVSDNGITPEQTKIAKELQKNKIESIEHQIAGYEERKKWNRVTGEQLAELEKLKQKLVEEQSIYNGLENGTSEVYINEYDVPQIRKKQAIVQQKNNSNTIQQPINTISETWQKAQAIQEPSGRRPVEYTSPGQPARTYYVEGEHIYNDKGKEVYNAPQMRTHKNKILFKLAYKEGRAVIVNLKGNRYIVDRYQNILSVKTGEVMMWGDENRDRRDILALAENSFRDKLNTTQTSPQQPQQNQSQQITTQQSALPGPETKINIYAGTGENADLSNFAERPFTIPEDFWIEVPSRRDISYGTIGLDNSEIPNNIKYRSVEAAFQGIKSSYSETAYPVGTDFEALRKQGKALRREDFAKMSGSEARSNGRKITDLDRESWDKDSSVIMKALIKLSFEQNPQALQRLLATGNATLTHTQDRGKWGAEFPKLLMEVREELRKEHSELAPQQVPTQQQSQKTFTTETALGDKVQVNSIEQALAIQQLYEMFDEMEESKFEELKNKILNASPEEVSKINIPMSSAARKHWNDRKQEVQQQIQQESKDVQPNSPQQSQPRSLGERETVSQAMEKTVKTLDDWLEYSRAHIKVDKENHKYYIDGEAADYSVTEYAESVFGKPDIKGDYSHSSAIGNTADAVYRDYFDSTKDVYALNYPNTNAERKAKMIQDAQRFEAYLDKVHGVKDGVRQYKVITREFPIAARFDTPDGMKTIAGTMDMIVIDKNGDIWIYDFKAKNHPITQTYYGKEVSDRRNYTAQQNLYRAILDANSTFEGQVKGLNLVWMDTAYPKLSEAQYKTDKKTGEVTVVVADGKTLNIPLAEYDGFKTPSLKPNVEDSIIPLDITDDIENLHIPELHAMDFITRQVIDYIKSLGIPVHTREELIQYLKDHGYENIQQAFEEQREMQDIRERAIKNGQIKLKADGSFDYALAPNGKRSNLNERQWLQVRTKPFINWFGDWINDSANASKVVDENGEPLVVYNGNRDPNIRIFKPGKGEFNNDPAYYFTPKYGIAYSYTDNEFAEEEISTLKANMQDLLFLPERHIGQDKELGLKETSRQLDSIVLGKVYPVFLNMRNPAYNVDKAIIVSGGTVYERYHEKYDGAISEPVIDRYHDASFYKEWEHKEYGAPQYVVFNSNQIKSATDNIGTFSTENDDIQMMAEDNNIVNPIKPEYQGKLIYAQSGTGKSTIADNINVFDSDYLLGQVLGVSTETAGFFFKTLSAEQKKSFGEQYRDLIRQKIAEGKTVLTANASMLSEADVVIYNQTAEQTEERVNSKDRAINNRYSALDYHQDTIDKIKQLKENEKNKEFIELGNEEYLSDYLLSDSNAAHINSVLENRRNNLGGLDKKVESRLTQEKFVQDFLDAFGININNLDSYNGELPLFDALNRVINVSDVSEITDAVGYAIAFMMQGDPEMQEIFVASLGFKGDFNTKLRKVPGIKRQLNIGTIQQGLSSERDAVIKEVGSKIAEELRKAFNTNDANSINTKENKSIWNIIKKFFLKLTAKIFIKAPKISSKEKEEKIDLFVSDIVEALGREDFSRIKGPQIKPGTKEKAQIVDAEQAFEDNPFEADIIEKLSNKGIALAGSTSIALEGTLYRPSENPLHDIDFSTPDNTTKEDLDKILPEIFGKENVAYVSSISKKGLIAKLTGNKEKGNATITYVVFDKPFTVKNINSYTQEYYDKEGNLIGKRYYKNGVQLDVADGVQGKLLDFFTGPKTQSEYGFYKKTIKGKDYLISSSKGALAAKILWARPKDMWDYKNFKKTGPEEVKKTNTEEVPFYLLKTPKGEVEIYGFIDPETLDMYLDDATINPEHPIHEYTHLWDRALYGMDPDHKLWNQGVKLMKQLKLWKEIENSEQYGQKWKKKGLDEEKIEFLIGSEVHSRLVGKEGEALLERIANEEGQKGLIGKLKEWILSAWQALKGLMSDWSDEDIQNLTLKDFTNMVVKDLADGIVPQMILKNQAEERSTAGEEGRSSNMETTETQEKPEVLSLPNFERLINNQQPIEITSSELWKVPLLEKLDDSISDSNTDEKNQEIVDEITTLIQSVTEDEYKQNTKKIKKTQEKINEYKRLNDQVNALKGNNLGLESYEIRHVAEQVVDSISDIITKLQSGKSTIKNLFPDFKTDFNPKGASRIEIVTKIGIDNFISLTQERMRNAVKGNAKSLRDVAQFALLTKNWEALMTFAQDQFVANEGFGVRKSHTKKGFDVDANAKIDLTNAEDDRNDTDGVREVKGDAQEHWQVVFRTIDILNSMSEKVRMALHECYKIDKNGNHVMSKWGIPERVDKREAVQSIIRWTQGALTLNQMIEKLAAQQEKNPWLNQLLIKLRDKNQSDFQSQFFGVMNKHFQLYSIVRLKNGKYVSMFINEHPAQTELMQSVKAMHKMGNHPLFTNSGINTENLGFLHSYLDELNKIALNLREREKVLKRKDTKAVAQLTEEERQKAFQCLSAASKMLGFMIPDEAWDYAITGQNLRTYGSDRGMVEYLNDVVKSLDNVVKNKQKDYDPFKFKGENNISGSLGNFLKFVTDHMDNTTSSSFYDDGNMYQSYVIPSFMTKLMSKFHGTPEEVEKFINEEYGKSEWFFDKKNNRWRINWLQRALKASSDGVLSHKVELNFNKHSYMRTMTDAEYAVSLLSEYVAEASKGKTGEFLAWFRVPMLSNKPSSEFIRFYAFTGMNYKNDILDGMLDIFEQELSRIQTVRMRNKKKGDPGFIKNWDTNGRKFCFLPFLNEHLAENSSGELANLLKKKLEGKTELSAEQEKRLSDLVKEQIKNHIDGRVKSIMEEWDAMGIMKAAEKVDNLGDNEEAIRNKVEEFLWNDTFASKMILQLTIGDIAFYKDAEDLQKRLAQIHAPGIRANVDAIDYAGNPVSADGKYRTFIIKDFDDFKSNIIANISEVFNRKIARARNDQERKSLEALKDSLVRPRTYKEDGSVDDPGGAYWNINVADAQGYSSPTSYRKKAFMFGKWSREAEDIYQRLLNGDYDYTSLKVAFQPLKPFVYSRIEKSTDVAGAPITKIYSPFQAKNAEYLLIMADAIMRGEENKTGALSRPNLLKAIYDIMEDSAYDGRERDEQGKIIEQGTYNGKGIDTVQFESAIKSTLQSPINLHQFANKENGEREAYKHIRGIIYKNGKNTNKVKASDYDTTNSVHEVAFEDYCLQQEVPEHFKDHEQAHGSQIRMIIPSDLDYYYDPNRKDKDAPDNIVYYDVKQPNGKIKRYTASEFRAEYEKLISQNIEESLKDLAEELHLNSNDKKERNIILSEFLQREIVDSPRYGIDLFQACSVDENGEFRIPLGDPIQAKRIEQLINSLIKNRVNKQKLPGGPVVQVSNFGTSKTLHIRFKDKAGNIIPLEDEYNPSEHDGKSYKQYLKENQAGIAYAEVYAPVYSDELIEKFGRPDGTIDVAAIEKLDPDLLTMVSYRIPTEDKYSCLPMKIVGFLPREAGEAIMLPYELTTIDGSDFDVDKRYIMRKDLKIVEDRNKKFRNLLQRVSKSYASKHDGKAPVGNVKKKIIDGINMFLDNPEEMKHASKFDEWLYNELKDIREKKENIWKVVHDTTGRRARNNQIIDMTLAVLTHERTADKILNPGGFDEQKEIGYMVSAYKNPDNKKSWKELEGVAKGKDGISELKKLSYVEKDLTWADTQVHFYHQNNAGSSLIGVFAVNKVAHATLGDDNIKANINYICGRAFNIAGFKFENDATGGMVIDPMYDAEGNLIGKTLGSLVGASADTAKDPVLDLMNINMETAGMLTTMLRMGMPFRDAALFLSQDVITKALAEHSKRKLEKYVSIESVVQEWVSKYESNNKITDDSHIHEEELTREELIKGLKGEESLSSRYKVMKNFLRIKALANAMRRPTFATRFNSISSAVGPLVVDNLILEHKMEDYAMNPNFKEGEDQHQFIYEERDKDGKKTGKWIGCYLKDVFGLHPILNSFSKTVGMAHQMFEDMPTGSNGFKIILNTMTRLHGSGFTEKFFKNKKLLDQLSLFYQSAMLVQGGLIDPSRLNYYIEDFPKDFMDNNYKEKYADNALINAIRLIPSSNTDRTFLTISLTGLTSQEKERLSSAWDDLHKKDPKLSQDLFNYCFFRAGIGFSPKTFISLVDTYVKENLSGTDADGNKVSYVDIFRQMPNMNPEVLIDLFMRNNWDNKRIVPAIDTKEMSFIYSSDGIEVHNDADKEKLTDTPYFTTEDKSGKTHLWKYEGERFDRLVYREVKLLGDNNEYVVILKDSKQLPTIESTGISEDTVNPDIDNSNIDGSEAEIQYYMESNPTEESEMSDDIEMKQNTSSVARGIAETSREMVMDIPGLDPSKIQRSEDMSNLNLSRFSKRLDAVLQEQGVTYDEKEVKEELDKYC